jgi:PD-(D/E)XK nuclease superfamily
LKLSELRLFDNTRLQDFRRCPRYYFFRHVKHWTPDGSPSAPLAFGGAWHAGMDALWQAFAHDRVTAPRAVKEGLDAFMRYWLDEAKMPDEDFMDDDDRRFWAPRLPSTAHEMLWAYAEARERYIKEVELLEVERSFAVPLSPIDPTLFYVGRIDKIVRPKAGRIRGKEHKTTTASKMSGKKMRIRPLFMDSFSPNSQVDGYLYALSLLYPDDETDVWVDAALVNGTHQDFVFIPVERPAQMLDNWLHTTHWWIDLIAREMEQYYLDKDYPDVPYMRAFPQDTRSCFDFNVACPFLFLCKSRANPLSWRDEVPASYKIEEWNPLDHLGTPKELL